MKLTERLEELYGIREEYIKNLRGVFFSVKWQEESIKKQTAWIYESRTKEKMRDIDYETVRKMQENEQNSKRI